MSEENVGALASSKTLHVIFFREGELWLGQCLEHDIVSRGQTLEEAQKDMERVIMARVFIAKILDRPEEMFNIPPAPKRFWVMARNGTDLPFDTEFPLVLVNKKVAEKLGMEPQEILQNYICRLKIADPADAREFQHLLTFGMEFLSLTDKEIVTEFGISRPTLVRWRNGNNAPHPAMREAVYCQLIKVARARLPAVNNAQGKGEGQ